MRANVGAGLARFLPNFRSEAKVNYLVLGHGSQKMFCMSKPDLNRRKLGQGMLGFVVSHAHAKSPSQLAFIPRWGSCMCELLRPAPLVRAQEFFAKESTAYSVYSCCRLTGLVLELAGVHGTG